MPPPPGLLPPPPPPPPPNCDCRSSSMASVSAAIARRPVSVAARMPRASVITAFTCLKIAMSRANFTGRFRLGINSRFMRSISSSNRSRSSGASISFSTTAATRSTSPCCSDARPAARVLKASGSTPGRNCSATRVSSRRLVSASRISIASSTTSGGRLSHVPPPLQLPQGGGTSSSAQRSNVSDQNSVWAIDTPASRLMSWVSCRRLPSTSISFISSSTVRSAGCGRRAE